MRINPVVQFSSCSFPSAFIATIQGGDPVVLPEHIISNLELDTHTYALSVSDGINAPVTKNISVQILDTTASTQLPVASNTILWPSNHKMVDVTREADASDNTGCAVTLSVEVPAAKL